MSTDFTPNLSSLDEVQLSAYRVQLSRLKDLTLSDEEHEVCRRKIDELLGRGPVGRITKLEHKLEQIIVRLERAEKVFAAFTSAATSGGVPHLTPDVREAAEAMAQSAPAPILTPPAESAPTAPPASNPTAEGEKPKKRGRGRPKGSKNKKTEAAEAQAAAGVAQVTNSAEAQAAANPATPVNGGEPVPTPPPAGLVSTNEVPAGQTLPAAAQGTADALKAAATQPPSAPLFSD